MYLYIYCGGILFRILNGYDVNGYGLNFYIVNMNYRRNFNILK